MAALRASFAIAPEVLLKFNEMVPAGERSQVIQSLMQRALAERQKRMDAIAEDFDTHIPTSGSRAATRPLLRRSPTGSTNKYGDRARRNLSG
jgi:hypothetical protein